jgi:hypothetical protein
MLIRFQRNSPMTRQMPLQTCRLFLVILVFPLLFSACSQVAVVDSWKADKPATHKPVKVAVIAVLPDALMRESVEIDAVKILAGKGTPAVASSKIPGMSGGIRGEIDVEVATGLLRQADVDGIIVMFYAGGGESDKYVRSDYWLEYLGSGAGYSWGRPYFTGMTSVYTVRQGPGYADFKTTAYVETSYYDLETELPVWRIVTFTKDVEHSDTVKSISDAAAREMRSAGLN